MGQLIVTNRFTYVIRLIVFTSLCEKEFSDFYWPLSSKLPLNYIFFLAFPYAIKF